MTMWFGSTEWHPEPQWLLTAIDTEKNAERDFAWSGIDFQGGVAEARAEPTAQVIEEIAQTLENPNVSRTDLAAAIRALSKEAE